MSVESVHRELRCQNKSCAYDMRHDRETGQAIADYLEALSADVGSGKVRHVSLSVHRAEPLETR